MLKELKILIVEDDPLSLTVLFNLLYQLYFCKIDTAETATEALDLVNDRAFEWDAKGYDIILMDIYLPDINGDLLTEVIRKTEAQTQATPIIAISARASSRHKKVFQKMGITDLILKPVTIEKCHQVFKKYLSHVGLYTK